MKGLLIKDLKLMKGQERFFLIIVLMVLTMAIFWKDSLFIISYVTLVFAIFAGTTIAYDEQDHGFAYLFTLPFTKKEYVKEKYLFGLITSVIPWAAASMIFYVVRRMRGETAFGMEEIFSAVTFLLIAQLTFAVMVPLQLKFGSEKSRFAIFGCFLGLMLIGFVSTKTLEWMGIAWKQKLDGLMTTSPGTVLGILVGVSVLVLLVSYFISRNIVLKKEF